MVEIEADNVSAKWVTLVRGICLFNTAAIGASSTIQSATLSFFGLSKDDSLAATPDCNVYSSAPASNTVVAASDYNTLGSTPFSTAITYAGWSTTAYNDFVLNSDGLAAISKIGVSKFGCRNASYDVANSSPTWSSAATSNVRANSSNVSGTVNDPKLVVTYTTSLQSSPFETLHLRPRIFRPGNAR